MSVKFDDFFGVKIGCDTERLDYFLFRGLLKICHEAGIFITVKLDRIQPRDIDDLKDFFGPLIYKYTDFINLLRKLIYNVPSFCGLHISWAFRIEVEPKLIRTGVDRRMSVLKIRNAADLY